MEIVSNLSVFKTTIKILLLVTPPLFYFKVRYQHHVTAHSPTT